MGATIGPGFVGRATERAVLDGVLTRVRAGESEALVLRGEAGIGKSALLRYAARQASGFHVAQIAGVEVEMELPFAGLHQLWATMPDHLDALPAPQKQALAIAMGLTAGPAPERFHVGLALLGLLSSVAEERPLLCLVEDAQWLDAASAQVIGLAARRVRGESVGILVAIREPADGHDFAGLPELHVDGLDGRDAVALLAGAVTGPLDRAVAERIAAEARGNPLALLELPTRMPVAEMAGGFALPSAGELPAQIEDHYLQRARELPEPTQHLMLVAAAEPLGEPEVVIRAARLLEIEGSALGPASNAGLLDIGSRVQFRHPLVRSAVYRSAPAASRQRVHEALAEVSDPESDGDRRAWHRALATVGTDEEVASELEASAARAQARGGVAAAAAFLHRATALTPDPRQRAARAVTAAQTNIASGNLATARALLATAEAASLDEGLRAHVDLLRAQLAFISTRGTDAIPLLLAAAHKLEGLDASAARETYVDAFSAAVFGARLNESIAVREIADTAHAVSRSGGAQQGTVDLLLDALVALADDYAAAVPLCRQAVQRLASDTASTTERLRWLWQACILAFEIWDDEHAALLSGLSVDAARETGTLSELALALSARTPILVFFGDLEAATATVAESASVQEATGIRTAPYGALMVSAWRGRKAETLALIETAEQEATARGEGIGLAICEYARAVLFNALGEYEHALAAAVSASEHRETAAENWGLSQLVEPATRCGRLDVARDALERLSTKAQAAQTDWALGTEARARALLGDGDSDGLFRAAIAQLRRTGVRGELARSHLLYGEWLRRQGRRVDARAELNLAHELFTAMGMEAFAARTESELVATGEKRRQSAAETRDDLTAQERQIAELARDGLSNNEIGARLFLSPRTIEWHLRHVYSKLGIRSRRELRAAL